MPNAKRDAPMVLGMHKYCSLLRHFTFHHIGFPPLSPRSFIHRKPSMQRVGFQPETWSKGFGAEVCPWQCSPAPGSRFPGFGAGQLDLAGGEAVYAKGRASLESCGSTDANIVLL